MLSFCAPLSHSHRISIEGGVLAKVPDMCNNETLIICVTNCNFFRTSNQLGVFPELAVTYKLDVNKRQTDQIRIHLSLFRDNTANNCVWCVYSVQCARNGVRREGWFFSNRHPSKPTHPPSCSENTTNLTQFSSTFGDNFVLQLEANS